MMDHQDFVRRLLQSLEAERQASAQATAAAPNREFLLPGDDPAPALESGRPIEYAPGLAPPGLQHLAEQSQGKPFTAPFEMLRSPDLQLDIPVHYGYGEEWDEKGWLDLLSQFRGSTGPRLRDLVEALQAPPPTTATPGRFSDLLSSHIQPLPAVPELTAPAPPSRLFKRREDDTISFSNVPPLGWKP